MTTKKMSVEDSKYKKNALAFKVSTYYVFNEKSKFGAMSWRLSKLAKKTRWSHILAYEKQNENGDMVCINAGDPKFPASFRLFYCRRLGQTRNL